MSSQSKKLWFKRRRYGYGWTPVTWQGWLTIILFVAAVLTSVLAFLPAKPAKPTIDQLLFAFGGAIISFIIFATICSAKSPTPRWRWGKKADDNPDEDF